MDYFIITPDVQKLAFFSTFELGLRVSTSKDELHDVHMDLPFLIEIVTGTFDVAKYTQDELIKAIYSLSYLVMDTTKAVEELVWSSGGGSGCSAGSVEEEILKFFTRVEESYSVRRDLDQPLRGELLARYPNTYKGYELGIRYDDITLMWNVTDVVSVGNLRLLIYMHENNYHSVWNEHVSSMAAKHGYLKCLQYLHTNGCPLSRDICTFAAESGSIECLEYLHDCGMTWGPPTCEAAARGGHLDCLVFLREHKDICDWNKFTSNSAAAYGHLDCLVYAYEHKDPCELMYTAAELAVSNGHFECMKYVHERIDDNKRGYSLCEISARYGYLNCLVYAHQNGYPLTIVTYMSAVDHGHLECLQYLHENDGIDQSSKLVINTSLGSPDIDCIKYLHEQGYRFDQYICSSVACNGDLDCLVYLHQAGYEMDVHTCNLAAEKSINKYTKNPRHLECLNYAYRHVPLWNMDTFNKSNLYSCTSTQYKIKDGVVVFASGIIY
jgi:hypothetical protein